MATKLALWSITLLPGDKYPLYIRNDFQITNAALPEDLANPNGRSVVKVTYQPINPALLADDSDSEIDSDDEISFPDEDEFELDEEEGFKEVAKKGEKKVKANGVKPEEEEEDEEDDDEEESEDDDDFSDEEPEVTNVLCALTAGKIEQAQLNLTFTEGDAVIFEVTGENAVHLMGNYIRQPQPYDSDDDSEYDSDEYDDYDNLYDEDDEEDDEEDVAGKITEIPAQAEKAEKKSALKKAAPAAAAPAVADKKRKADAIESPASKTPAAAAAAASTETLSKKQKKKLAQQAQNAPAPAASAAAAAAPVKGNKRTTPSGLVIDDVKVGDGPAAKRGKRLGMRYIGKLTNGKQFDANTGGKPFSFVLGRGEVIKGWDEGLEGMKVGGERRLTIPANLAYGKSKLPGIPANSTLNFDVKLVSIN